LPNRRAFRPPPEPEPAAEETAHEEETTMAYQQKDMSGALFKNTDKKGDKSPDYTGSVMIGGAGLLPVGMDQDIAGGHQVHVAVV
jgi:hypothetical protein